MPQWDMSSERAHGGFQTLSTLSGLLEEALGKETIIMKELPSEVVSFKQSIETWIKSHNLAM